MSKLENTEGMTPDQVIGIHAAELMDSNASHYPEGTIIRSIVTVVEAAAPDPEGGDRHAQMTTVAATTSRPHLQAAVLKLGLNLIGETQGEQYLGGRSF